MRARAPTTRARVATIDRASRRLASSRVASRASRGAAAKAREVDGASLGDVLGASTRVEAIEVSGSATRARWIANDGALAKKPPIDARTGEESTSAVPELRRIFLPSGFPESVSSDYVAWLKWHLLSLLFRDVLEVLTAQSLLVALGMGSTPGALPLTAAAKWVLKDGVGSIATLLAGSFGGQKYDEDPKRWWGVTNALEDVARAIELATPVAPALFLPLAASATFVRCAALTGRGSLINGSFMQHFGRKSNLGDIRAKLEVQGRWLALVGLPVGIQVFQVVSTSAAGFVERGDEASAFAVAFGAYGTVITAHCLSCWQSARALKFDILNRYRLLKLADAFVDAENDELLDVDALGDIEGVYAPRVTPSTPTFGADPSELSEDWNSFIEALRLANTRSYVLGFDPKRSSSPSAMLLNRASPRDTFAAALACQKLQRLASSATTAEARRAQDTIAMRVNAYAYADARVLEFEAAMIRSGWRVDFVQLGVAPTFVVDIAASS
mmetsp:Transcript_1045/g.3345  ORF Transcript_1045/g.3345 Transcript_1045/m.3345 type:complete len:500 (+) Transcript_1045:39-1538(+)